MDNTNWILGVTSFVCLSIALAPLILIFAVRSRSKKKFAVENPDHGKYVSVEEVWSFVAKSWDANRQLVFQARYKDEAKSTRTAQLLAIFLGGIGAHWYYVGNMGRTVLYVAFCWTFIPMILGFLESDKIQGIVRRQNGDVAVRIARQMA